MKTALLTLFSIVPALAQFLTPDWRGNTHSSHAEWDVFTAARFSPNFPDVVADDATIICTTPGAFLTGGGNIYSFQAPTFFQLDDTAEFVIQNVFLQISAMGSGVDVSGARLIATNSDGDTVALPPVKTFISSEEELTGERGGIATTYGIQWNLADMPVSGSYSILFNATESSLSLGGVSLDTSGVFVEIVKPLPLKIEPVDGEMVITWFGDRQLQSSTSLESGWVDVPDSAGVNSIVISIAGQATFFRLQQITVTE